MPELLKVHELTTESGELAPVYLCFEHGALSIRGPAGDAPLPEGALAAAMKRFGAPLEPSEAPKLGEVARLDLGGGAVLRHVRHLARYDVVAKDYLVLEAPGAEPICALATTVTGALQHLAAAAARSAP